MQFDIITIFPKLTEAIFSESILKRASDKDLIKINIYDLRQFTEDKRKTVDAKPFGGGPGMLMMVEPIYRALKSLDVYPTRDDKTKVILTSANGKMWDQTAAEKHSKLERLVIICGHYEGVDHRVVENLIDEQVSIGNYVLTGGELAAGIIVDSTARLIEGVLGNPESLLEESHVEIGTGEYPQYTRPAEFTTSEGETWSVPEILRSGHHANIKNWQTQQVKN